MTTSQESTHATTSNSSSLGLLNLDKELTCSICTDILYQPLTLLDCLHTFCGGCLKEWFSWQKVAVERKIRQEGRAPTVLYTCPSCRAAVRDTRPNASITTLLDMYLAANPDKGKSEAEKKELDVVYKRGESVLPEPLRVPEVDSSDEETERRMLREVRQLTLDEMSSSRRSTEGRRRTDGRDRRVRRTTGGVSAPPHQAQVNLEHQASLRSLLSAGEFDTTELEQEIVQQIVSGGLLDGIDLRTLDQMQEEELTERIAAVYRQRQREGRAQRERARESSQGRPRNTERRTRENILHPPLSRPHLLDTASDSAPNQRTISQGSEIQTATRAQTAGRRNSGEHVRPATRSAAVLSMRPRSTSRPEQELRPTTGGRVSSRSRERRSTDPHARSITEAWRAGSAQPSTIGGVSPPVVERAQQSTPRTTAPPPAIDLRERNLPNSQARALPSLACKSCGKPHIEETLHYACYGCEKGISTTYTLCLLCYRSGKGCKHWFGFGHAALARFARSSYPSGQPPHVMQAQRYVRGSEGGVALQTGRFCDMCHENTNSCYWICDVCNDGEWGFCDFCVGQARHCTHHLCATAAEEPASSATSGTLLRALPIRLPCNICHSDIPLEADHLHCPKCNDGDFDMCIPCYKGLMQKGLISTKDGLQGWRRCPRGHRMLVVTFAPRERKASPAVQIPEAPHLERFVVANVVGGWSFADIDGGTEPVSRDNSSGNPSLPQQWSWKENDGQHTSSPPAKTHSATPQPRSSKTMLALWTRIPEEEATDELSFPRGAEITEVVSINEDWAWGIYCRRGGLFPANYARDAT